MRSLTRSIVLALAFFHSVTALKAQTPIITAVVNDVTGDKLLAPGLRVRIYYSPVLAIDALNNSGQPTVSIRVGGKPGSVIAVAGGPADAVLPMDAPPGPTTLILTTSGGASAPFDIRLDPYSPGLYPLSSYCAAVQPDGLHLRAIGLGVTNPLVPITDSVPHAGVPTVGLPAVTVGGRTAMVIKSVLLPSTSLLSGSSFYDVVALLDPQTSEGPQPVTLTIGGVKSNTVTVLNGPKSFQATGGDLSQAAAESIASFYGCSVPLAAGTFTGDSTSPPLVLGGTAVKVKDASGVERSAPIYYVSPLQVNYVVPQGSANGMGTVTVTSASGGASAAPLNIGTLQPAMFTETVSDPDYNPLPASVVVRVRNGVQTVEPTVRPGASGLLDVVPIDLGPDTDQVFLSVFGTGWHLRNALAKVKVILQNNQVSFAVDADYAGPQNEFPGLDQINVKLPRGFLGQDWAEIYVVVDGRASNGAILAFR